MMPIDRLCLPGEPCSRDINPLCKVDMVKLNSILFKSIKQQKLNEKKTTTTTTKKNRKREKRRKEKNREASSICPRSVQGGPVLRMVLLK